MSAHMEGPMHQKPEENQSSSKENKTKKKKKVGKEGENILLSRTGTVASQLQEHLCRHFGNYREMLKQSQEAGVGVWGQQQRSSQQSRPPPRHSRAPAQQLQAVGGEKFSAWWKFSCMPLGWPF